MLCGPCACDPKATVCPGSRNHTISERKTSKPRNKSIRRAVGTAGGVSPLPGRPARERCGRGRRAETKSAEGAAEWRQPAARRTCRSLVQSHPAKCDFRPLSGKGHRKPASGKVFGRSAGSSGGCCRIAGQLGCSRVRMFPRAPSDSKAALRGGHPAGGPAR